MRATLLLGALFLVPALHAQERIGSDSTMLPAPVRQLMHRTVTNQFVDPGSAQYEYDFVRVWQVDGVTHFLVCGRVNAKNRMGGYAGRQPYMAHVSRRPDGSLRAERSGVTAGDVDVVGRGMEDAMLATMYRALCLDMDDQPRRPPH